MVLFFQVDIPPDIPDFGGDHLLVFLTWLKLVRTAVVDAGEGIAEVVG
jgi:hypothetical protein